MKAAYAAQGLRLKHLDPQGLCSAPGETLICRPADLAVYARRRLQTVVLESGYSR